MKKISSELTPIVKYFVPWTIFLLLPIAIIGLFIGGQSDVAIGLIIIGAPIVGFTRSMLMGLKQVFLDKENKTIVVKGATNESISYEDIREILRPWTPPYIATVHLSKPYSFGRTFTFIPADHPIFWDNYDEDLKAKIRK
jgi:hypothetical protein